MSRVGFSRPWARSGLLGLALSVALLLAPASVEAVPSRSTEVASNPGNYTPATPATPAQLQSHSELYLAIAITSPNLAVVSGFDSYRSVQGYPTQAGEGKFGDVLKPDPLSQGGIISSAVGMVLHLLPSLHDWALVSLVSVLIAATFAMLMFDQRRVPEGVRFDLAPNPTKPVPRLNLRALIADRQEAFIGARRSITLKAAALLETASHRLQENIQPLALQPDEAAVEEVAPVDPIKLLLTRIILALVDHEDKVVITETLRDQTHVFLIHVATSDVGKVLGRRGTNIFAIRTLMTAVSGRIRKRYVVEIAERGSRHPKTSSRPCKR